MLVKIIGWIALIAGIIFILLSGLIVIGGAKFGTAGGLFITSVLCVLNGWRLIKRKS